MIAKILTNLILVQSAFAQRRGGSSGGSSGEPAIKLPNPLKFKTIEDLLTSIGQFAVSIGAAVASLLIVYAAYQILTAGGDEEKFKTGKRTIFYAVIGLVVLLLSSAIIKVVKEVIGVKR